MVKVTIMFGKDGLQDIQVNNDYLDVDAIKQKPVEEWFEESDGRDGWKGLLNEIYEKVGDSQADLIWEIWGSEDVKKQFKNCLVQYNIPASGMEDVGIESTKQKMRADAQKFHHREQYKEAFKLYKSLADNYNDADAQCRIGEYYYNNYTGEDESKEKAFTYYEKAAEQGNEEAEFWTGRCLALGEGVKTDTSEAVKWYTKAAEKGHPKAQNNLGNCYATGDGIEKNEEKAVKWYRKAADQKETNAQYNLGNCYHDGKGTLQDYNKAYEYYKKSAEQENAYAQTKLGFCYKYGEGVEKDLEKAYEWFQKGAEQGNVVAQRNLGICYGNGEGTEQNFTKEYEWYQKAADQGDEFSQCNLGWCYEKGSGVEQNWTKAFEWYQKSAEQGDICAQSNLGWCYEYGKGTNQNYSKAFEWYKKAAEQGEARAQKNLGWCYEHGKGVKQDRGEAYEWYKKAADAENPDDYACYKMGQLYYEESDPHILKRTGILVALSIFVPISNFITVPIAVLTSALKSVRNDGKFRRSEAGQKGIAYYRKAAELGNKDAKEKLKSMGVTYNG